MRISVYYIFLQDEKLDCGNILKQPIAESERLFIYEDGLQIASSGAELVKIKIFKHYVYMFYDLPQPMQRLFVS